MQPMADSQVNAFLNKLWKMVNDPSTNHLICWAPTGSSFIIQNQAQFWYELLPVYYKHNNMSSFVRQLNMYGFHKMSTIENGAMDYDKDEIQFFHQYFQKNKPELMKFIKRKVTGSAKTNQTISLTNTKPSTMSPEKVTKLLTDMQQLKGRQNTVDTQLTTMKQENAILWRELALLRQQHIKQRQLVNKLIHFLVTIVQPTGRMSGLGVKRRYPLMLNENPKKPKSSKSSSTTSEGPIIHELDNTELPQEDLLINTDLEQEVQATEPSEEIGVDRLFESPDIISSEMDDLISDTELPDDIETNVNWEAPGGSSNNLKVFLNPSTQDTLLSNLMNGSYNSNTIKDLSAESESDMAVAKRDPNQTLKRLHSVCESVDSEDLDIHVESTQNELDQLKSLLNGYSTLDANTLLGLFNHDETPAYGLATKSEEKMKLEDPLMSGSELAPYSTPLDFSQLFNDDSLEETVQEPLPMSNVDAKGSITTPQVIADEPLFPVGASSSTTKNKK
ncbi:PREDICTED: heat shock factor protein isoform X2 [Nicrophorus vespilloides]|uniref:Heat shock factor protein isoform X2 n=1 Tax=Nicrophorus vespilloides TaxID=110193 RepID=A0ABM1M7Q3_NICVS|nr:PREDICTED: heat shock factor protein isoform X2 [Nicrophorus vespilloides]